jgi:pyruvate kinase
MTLHENFTYRGYESAGMAEITRAESVRGRDLAELMETVSALRRELLKYEAENADLVLSIHEDNRRSARSLLHYVSLRRHDIRQLQVDLAALGLSSLGRSEAHVLSSVDAVTGWLTGQPVRESDAPADLHEGHALLKRNTEALFGPRRPNRHVRIMVTMPSAAAHEYALVRSLVASGMDVMRINCAHDGPTQWGGMIERLRRAERDVGRPCRVLMDLGGPKLRTGPIAPGPAVVRWKPDRDAVGKSAAPARVWLTAAESAAPPPVAGAARLFLPEGFLSELSPGDVLAFTDARGKSRQLKIAGEGTGGLWAECSRAARVADGTKVTLERGGQSASVGPLPPADRVLLLRPGDRLLLTRRDQPGRPAVYDSTGRVLAAATVSCTLPEVFSSVRPGERIWFDDGKFAGVIREAGPEQALVEITNARPEGEKLRSDKGVNLPDTTLALPSLTPKDIEDLPFVAEHADIVGLSFVQRAADVDDLRVRLADLGAPDKGVVLKIETRAAFENLLELLLAALRLPRAGVMIARGDLLVEIGYERLAEVQEEILWLCEAAHVPVIWATQVLEGLAQKGLPSRAEITDAAMGGRAECVMLNKGPHIVEAVRVLDNILQRMQAHQSKKSSRLRRLHF